MQRDLDPRFNRTSLDYQLGDMPPGWRSSVTGRKETAEDPPLERLGIYLRRARYIAGRSQMSVSRESGVPQSQLSRLERALAPAMAVERLGWIEEALKGAFPVGYCPHDHACQWRQLPRRMTDEEWLAAELKRQEEITRQFGLGRHQNDSNDDDAVEEDDEPEGDD